MFADKKHLVPTSKALAIFAWTILASTSSTLPAAPKPCTTRIPLDAGETWRDPGRGAAESVCFDVDIDTPGILAFDLVSSIPAAEPAAPRARLIFDGPGRLRQSPTSLLTAWTPGTHRIRVEGENPRQPLPPFRLATRFSATVSKSETDSEIEVEPHPFAGCGGKSETDSEIEVEPHPFAGCGAKSETDSGLYDLTVAPTVVQPAEICRRDSSDDHGDSFLCSTALSPHRTIRGAIANDWGDDADLFQFQLRTLAAIEIDVRADADLVVELYDRHGLPIGAAASVRGHLRSVRTLVPGVYFFRIRGLAGSSGTYSIRLGP